MKSVMKQRMEHLKSIFSSRSLLFISILFIISIFLSGPQVFASEESMIDFGINSNGSEETVIAIAEDENFAKNQPSQTSKEKKSNDVYPDLGDDQVFPFVAGLDSYE